MFKKTASLRSDSCSPSFGQLFGFLRNHCSPSPEYAVVIALEDVSTVAQGIVTHIYDNPLGDEVPVLFIQAVGDVQSSAQAIVDTVDSYLLPSDCGACAAYLNDESCLTIGIDCYWVTDPFTDQGYCCDSDPGPE